MAKSLKAKESEVKKLYTVDVTFNGINFVTHTDDLEQTLADIAPRFLKTKVKIKIEKEGKVFDKMLFLLPAKMIFRNKIARKIFVNRLIFK